MGILGSKEVSVKTSKVHLSSLPSHTEMDADVKEQASILANAIVQEILEDYELSDETNGPNELEQRLYDIAYFAALRYAGPLMYRKKQVSLKDMKVHAQQNVQQFVESHL